MRIQYWLYFATILLSPPDLFAQNSKTNYALFWEISGNGLPAPSYIFGSMHVQDKRAFEFPDSLFHKMAACEAFAGEVHFDSAMNLMLHKIFNNNNIFPKHHEYQEKQHVVNETPSATIEKMPTYLDAYLMNIAKKMGKAIYGLEQIRDQFYLLKDNSPYNRDPEYLSILFYQTPAYKKMLDIYLSGDIDKIAAFLNEHGELNTDYDLVNRNYTQAESFIKIAKEQSLFSVVGAAHLPGEKGLLRTLYNKGYTVRPVEATFNHTVEPEYFSLKLPDWPAHQQETTFYEFSTPMIPVKIKAAGTPFEIFISADIGTGSFFQNTTFTKITYKDAPAQIEKSLLQNTEGDVLERKNIQGADWLATDIRIAQNTSGVLSNWRFRIIPYSNYIYVFQMGAFSQAGLTNEVAERYFNSFRPIGSPRTKCLRKLITDLAASDSSTATRAKKALHVSIIRQQDLPLVYQALQASYPDDDKGYGTKHLLLKILNKTQDDNTFAFLSSFVNNKSHTNLRTEALNLIIRCQHITAIDTFLAILEKFPQTKISYDSYLHIKNKLHLFQRNYPAFTKLSVQANTMLEYFQWSTACLQQKANDFIFQNLKQYELLLSRSGEIQDSLYALDPDYLDSIITFFNFFPFKENYALALKKHLHEDRPNQVFNIVSYLLKHKQAVEQQWIDLLLDSKQNHVALLECLHEHNQQQYIPPQLFKQRQIARALLEKATTYEFYPKDISFLEEQVLPYKGKKQKFYLYKLMQDKDGEALYFLGLVGPFSIQENEKNFDPEIIDWNYDPIKEDNIDQLFYAILGWYEE